MLVSMLQSGSILLSARDENVKGMSLMSINVIIGQIMETRACFFNFFEYLGFPPNLSYVEKMTEHLFSDEPAP